MINFSFNDLNNIKYKEMTREDLIISLDRLTRFKNPEIKYRRVFFDIISKHLISPSISRNKLDELEPEIIVNIVEKIWNNSVKNYVTPDLKCIFTLKDLDFLCFEIKDKRTLEYMNAKLEINGLINSLKNEENLPLNLQFLTELIEIHSKNYIDEIIEKRKEKKLLFPIKKLILTEGITEEILLPAFSDKMDYNFKKEGIYVLATGGKSRVLSIYAEFKYLLKIPVIVLLDKDAQNVYDDVRSLLRPFDKAIILQSGEFEDAISKDLIVKTFNNAYYDVEKISVKDLDQNKKMCDILDELHKIKGAKEFRKAHFAKAMKENITSKEDISNEIKSIIETIKTTEI